MHTASIKKLPHSEIEITATVSADDFEHERPAALKNLNQTIKLDGFRSGHIPEAILNEKLGEMAILEEMANLALTIAYGQIVADNNLQPIDRPRVRITKIARGNPLEYSIIVPVMPEIVLPDYKSLAEAERGKIMNQPFEVTEAEVAEAIDNIHKSKSAKEKEGGTAEVLPELTDAFAQSLGGDLKTVSELKAKIREGLQLEKEQGRTRAVRDAVMSAIAAALSVELPEILVYRELDRMTQEMRREIEQYGLEYARYLTDIKKTEAELREEWKEGARKRVLGQLALREIFKVEKLSLDEAKVKETVEHLKSSLKDADAFALEQWVRDQMTLEQTLQRLTDS